MPLVQSLLTQTSLRRGLIRGVVACGGRKLLLERNQNHLPKLLSAIMVLYEQGSYLVLVFCCYIFVSVSERTEDLIVSSYSGNRPGTAQPPCSRLSNYQSHVCVSSIYIV